MSPLSLGSPLEYWRPLRSIMPPATPVSAVRARCRFYETSRSNQILVQSLADDLP
jgi:hypothetical protein